MIHQILILLIFIIPEMTFSLFQVNLFPFFTSKYPFLVVGIIQTQVGSSEEGFLVNLGPKIIANNKFLKYI